MNKLLAIFIFSQLLFTSCNVKSSKSQGDSTSKSPSDSFVVPELRTDSPDAVVKSYWALQDWERDHGFDMYRESFHRTQGLKSLFLAKRKIASGPYGEAVVKEENFLDNIKNNSGSDIKSVFERDIIEVKSESETRAVVHAKIKNITPIPHDFIMEEYDEKQREYGCDVQYITEKTNGQWQLTQALHRIDAESSWSKKWENSQKNYGPHSSDFSSTYGAF
jgi:hypothetical protein